jgi:hypothetical protein
MHDDVPVDELKRQLAKRLYDLRHEGRIVEFAEAAIEDWQPKLKSCHENAAIWANSNKGWLVVHGWSIFEFSDPAECRLLGIPRQFHFARHSVVMDPGGRLYDITPSEASRQYPFIPHPTGNADFEEIAERYDLVFVDHFL